MSTTVSSNRNFPIELPLGLSVISGIFKFFINILMFNCSWLCGEIRSSLSQGSKGGGGAFTAVVLD